MSLTDDAVDAHRERDIAPTPRAVADALVAALMSPPLPRVYLCVGCDDKAQATGWDSLAQGCRYCGAKTNRYTTGTVANLRAVLA